MEELEVEDVPISEQMRHALAVFYTDIVWDHSLQVVRQDDTKLGAVAGYEPGDTWFEEGDLVTVIATARYVDMSIKIVMSSSGHVGYLFEGECRII